MLPNEVMIFFLHIFIFTLRFNFGCKASALNWVCHIAWGIHWEYITLIHFLWNISCVRAKNSYRWVEFLFERHILWIMWETRKQLNLTPRQLSEGLLKPEKAAPNQQHIVVAHTSTHPMLIIIYARNVQPPLTTTLTLKWHPYICSNWNVLITF